ncbi:hypothetical protein MKW94_024321, partial [Papaver nudicaule]|nr:hypothetical protein [Papaver nudicaule]
YGMGSEVSTNGDVYSYGIMVLELFTGKRPTDGMFTDGLSLHKFVKMALLRDRVMQIVDPKVLLAPIHPEDDDSNNEILIDNATDAKLCEALSGIVNLGVACSVESPRERMEMVQVVKELQSIKITFLSTLGSD